MPRGSPAQRRRRGQAPEGSAPGFGERSVALEHGGSDFPSKLWKWVPSGQTGQPAGTCLPSARAVRLRLEDGGGTACSLASPHSPHQLPSSPPAWTLERGTLLGFVGGQECGQVQSHRHGLAVLGVFQDWALLAGGGCGRREKGCLRSPQEAPSLPADAEVCNLLSPFTRRAAPYGLTVSPSWSDQETWVRP